jgi:hypothetical protein
MLWVLAARPDVGFGHVVNVKLSMRFIKTNHFFSEVEMQLMMYDDLYRLYTLHECSLALRFTAFQKPSRGYT